MHLTFALQVVCFQPAKRQLFKLQSHRKILGQLFSVKNNSSTDKPEVVDVFCMVAAIVFDF